MGILDSLKKGIEEGREEERDRQREEARLKEVEAKKAYQKAPPSKVGKFIGRVAEGPAGKVVARVGQAGAQTIGRAVVEGGRGLAAAGKKGLENYAVNTGIAHRDQKGKVVKQQRTPGGFMKALVGAPGPQKPGDLLLAGPPRGEERLNQGLDPRNIGAGLVDDALLPRKRGR